MGPINDQCGLEQGNLNSSDFYKIYAKEQLENAQKSRLGVSLGNLKISAIGQADDTVLLSNNIQNLQFLLYLTEMFCKRYHVTICAEKTKLQVYYTKNMELKVKYSKMTNPITLNGQKVLFTDCADHVGIARSTLGNSVSIFARINAHKRALGAILHTGLARGHRGNPAASLRVQKLYGTPVLLSGLAPLLLTRSEEAMVDQQQNDTIKNLQRLLPNTPRAVILFLAGSLPGFALLHMRKLSIFGMITRLTDNFINKHAVNIFTSATNSSKSWFSQIRQICLRYGLPHPLDLLQNPLRKDDYKKLIKSRVINYWELALRSEAAQLPSLKYFHSSYMSLTKPHPIWTSAASSLL